MVKLSVYVQEVVEAARRAAVTVSQMATDSASGAMQTLRENKAQGTTEYAILVGVQVSRG